VIKITVCRIKEQNVGWDEFGTYDVKGLRLFYMPMIPICVFRRNYKILEKNS